MEKIINRNRKSNILYFIYFVAFYIVIFTNNIYIFCILLAAIIFKYFIAIKNSFLILNQWDLQKQDFRKLNNNSRRKSAQFIYSNYLFIFLTLALIIAIIIYRFDFWSSYIFK